MFTHGKINTFGPRVNMTKKIEQKPEEPIVLEQKDEFIEIKEKKSIKLEGPIDMKKPPDAELPIPVKPKLEIQEVPKKKKNNKKKAETQVSENEKVGE